MAEDALNVPVMVDALRVSDARMTARLSAEEVRTLSALLRKLGPVPRAASAD